VLPLARKQMPNLVGTEAGLEAEKYLNTPLRVQTVQGVVLDGVMRSLGQDMSIILYDVTEYVPLSEARCQTPSEQHHPGWYCIWRPNIYILGEDVTDAVFLYSEQELRAIGQRSGMSPYR